MNQTFHLDRVESSAGTDKVLSSATTDSIHLLSYLLYGMSRSGSSWCILWQFLQRKRLIRNLIVFPALFVHFLIRLPILFSAPLQHGQKLCSLLLTKNTGLVVFKKLIIWYDNHGLWPLKTLLVLLFASVIHQIGSVFPFYQLWSLYPSIFGQAIPSAFGLLRLA